LGAASYNLFRIYATPGLLAALGLLMESPPAVSVVLVCLAHIGFDQMVGFRLKYPTLFGVHSYQHLAWPFGPARSSNWCSSRPVFS
jgi:hypothetical protein